MKRCPIPRLLGSTLVMGIVMALPVLASAVPSWSPRPCVFEALRAPSPSQHSGHPAKATEKPAVKADPGQHEHHQPSNEKPIGHEMPMDMQMDEMKGTQGDWSMSRQGSGTSWIPAASPMFMKMLPSRGGFDLGVMGSLSVNYADAGGRRGDNQLFSNSMGMLMARRGDADGGVFGFQFMASLDPVFNGKKGYPNLFQTGETENAKPLQDRQHPHDLLSEIAVSYSRPVGREMRAIGYFGIIGEPALGGSMFLMRPSGMENPEAPIGHHWFDATHISFGVATLGLAVNDQWKFEASTFNGTEPDENRYDIDKLKLDSYSGRVSYNPDPNWSMQASYGYLKEPEPVLESGVSQHRFTASLLHSRPMAKGDDLSIGLTYGRNIKLGGDSSNAIGLEATYFKPNTAYFARLERVDKDELVGIPSGTYAINKFTIGGVRKIAERDGMEVGVGGFIGLYAFPNSLESAYGKNPVSFGVFLRIRPSRMSHGKMKKELGGMD